MASTKPPFPLEPLRARYEAGELTQAEIAALAGVSRQAIHKRINALGWRRPTANSANPQAATQASRSAPSVESGAMSEAPGDPSDPYRDMRWPTHKILVQAQLRLLHEAVHGINRTTGHHTPQGLKRYGEVLTLVTNNLGHLGFFYDPVAATESTTTLRIEVMSEEEEAQVRSQAEREARLAYGGILVDDIDDWDDEDALLAGDTEAPLTSSHPGQPHAPRNRNYAGGEEEFASSDTQTSDAESALPVAISDRTELRLWLEATAIRCGRRLISDLCRRAGGNGDGDANVLIEQLLTIAATQPDALAGALRATRIAWARM